MVEKLAKDFKCSRCNRQAVVFLGIADPDMPMKPYCRACADKLRLEVYLETM